MEEAGTSQACVLQTGAWEREEPAASALAAWLNCWVSVFCYCERLQIKFPISL